MQWYRCAACRRHAPCSTVTNYACKQLQRSSSVAAAWALPAPHMLALAPSSLALLHRLGQLQVLEVLPHRLGLLPLVLNRHAAAAGARGGGNGSAPAHDTGGRVCKQRTRRGQHGLVPANTAQPAHTWRLTRGLLLLRWRAPLRAPLLLPPAPRRRAAPRAAPPASAAAGRWRPAPPPPPADAPCAAD